MAEVRLAVHVVNRRGDVKPFAHYRIASVADKCGDGKRESRAWRLPGREMRTKNLNHFQLPFPHRPENQPAIL
jgi:hypothetical protein